MRPATAVVGTLAVVALLVAPSVQSWVQQRSALAEERALVSGTAEELEQLRAQSRRWDDPEYVKAQARERLQYVMPGEKAYVVVDDRVRVPVSTSSSSEIVAGEVADTGDAWFTRVWDSLEIAGDQG